LQIDVRDLEMNNRDPEGVNRNLEAELLVVGNENVNPDAIDLRENETDEEDVGEGGNDEAADVVQDEPSDEEEPGDQDVEAENEATVSEGKWLTYSELMMDSYPSKSKVIYLKAYKNFERYLKSQNKFVPNTRPTELQVLNYFHYLRNEKKFAPTTLWSTYARVNACVKRIHGFSLKSFVSVSDCLKSYESGYKVKKASVFTPGEVNLSIKVTFILFVCCCCFK